MNSELQQVRRRIEQLDELLQAGSLSTDAHRSARSGLEQELVALVLARPQATIDRVKPSARLWLGLGLFVLLVAGAGYRWTGTPAALSGAAPAQPDGDGGTGGSLRQFLRDLSRLPGAGCDVRGRSLPAVSLRLSERRPKKSLVLETMPPMPRS